MLFVLYLCNFKIFPLLRVSHVSDIKHAIIKTQKARWYWKKNHEHLIFFVNAATKIFKATKPKEKYVRIFSVFNVNLLFFHIFSKWTKRKYSLKHCYFACQKISLRFSFFSNPLMMNHKYKLITKCLNNSE